MAKNHIKTLIAAIIVLLGVVVVVFLTGKSTTQKMLEGHHMWGVSVLHGNDGSVAGLTDPVVYVHCQDGKVWMGDMNLKHEDFENKTANLQVKYLSNDKVYITEMKNGEPSGQEGRFIVKEKTENGFILTMDGQDDDQEVQLKVFKY